MSKDWIEIPMVDIPDEITQVDRPEFDTETIHPSPEVSPQVQAEREGQTTEPIGFTKNKQG